MGDAGEAPKPIVKMEASALFFAGQIEVESLLAPGGMHWGHPGKDGKSGRRGGGGGGFHMGGGGGGMGGGGGGRRGGPGGMGGDDFDGPRSTMRASNLPPVQLRLRLTNHGPTPAVVEVLDFNSDLGNFVVQPEKITLPAGESFEADPMNSRLGIPGDEIPITVRLWLDGRTEKQILTLKLAPTPPAPVAPPPAS